MLYLPKTDSPLFAVSVVQGLLVVEPTTSAGAYVSSAHAGGSVGDVGLRMIWQSFSCSREKNPFFRRGLWHWRALEGEEEEERGGKVTKSVRGEREKRNSRDD